MPEKKSPSFLAKSCKIMPISDRGETAFLAKLHPWVVEDGFAMSFERCKDIAFKNGIQQMRATDFAYKATTSGR